MLETGMTLDEIAAQSSAPSDSTLMEPVEVLVPLPDALYDPNILVYETVAPIFNQEVTQATDARNLTLQEMEAAELQINTLNTAIGPNVPVNGNLIDPDQGLTPDEIAGRDMPPPYLPSAAQSFGTIFQIPWVASSNYSANYMVIDSNGNLQVAISSGASGTAAPTWNTNIGATTTDGTVTWLNNGPWTWQPDTVYVKNQVVIDPTGHLQTAATAGTSASQPPNWPTSPTAGQSTPDGIVWQANGNELWHPDTLYAVGQLVLDVNDNIQIVQTGGISDDNVPAWNQNLNQTTQDSGVTWQNLGHANWQPNTSYSAGQAVLDSKGIIQLATIGGTSGASQPTWNDGANATTRDTSVAWQNSGPMTWQSGASYGAGQLIVDPNGNVQYATGVIGAKATAGTTQPAWSTSPGGKTTDGGVNWICCSFASADIQQVEAVAAAAPYTSTFTDSAGTSHTLELLGTSDMTTLETNGLQALVNSLNTRISQANDLLDTAFLTVQTDIYRYRQNVLGATAATALATSPVLANIATGETAAATATNLQTYIGTLLPTTSPAATSSGGTTSAPPTYIKPIITPIQQSVVLAENPAIFKTAGTVSVAAAPQMLRTAAVKANITDVSSLSAANLTQTSQASVQQASSATTSGALKINEQSVIDSGSLTKLLGANLTATKVPVATGPVQIDQSRPECGRNYDRHHRPVAARRSAA